MDMTIDAVLPTIDHLAESIPRFPKATREDLLVVYRRCQDLRGELDRSAPAIERRMLLRLFQCYQNAFAVA